MYVVRHIQTLLFFMVFLGEPIFVLSQCLSDPEKLLPEKSTSTFDAYGTAVAINGEYAVVGAPRNDSLGWNSGLVYIYRKINGTWTREAMLASPNPRDLEDFGRSVDLSDEYLVVGGAEEMLDSPEGKVYVYRKPAAGWTSSMTPVATLSVAGAKKLGSSVKINAAGSAIVAGDIMHMAFSGNSSYPSGAVYIFRKDGAEWSSNAPHIAIIPDPTKLYFYFGIELDIDGNDIFIGSDTYDGNIAGAIDVYKANNDWSSAQHKVTLTANEETGYLGYPGKWFTAHNGRVAAAGNLYGQGIFVYVFEKGSEWGGSPYENYKVQIASGDDALSYPIGIAMTDNQVFVAASLRAKKDQLFVLNSSNGSFTNAAVQTMTISDRTFQAGAFGTDMQTDGTNLIVADSYSIEKQRSQGQVMILPVAPQIKLTDAQRLSEHINTTVEHNYGTAFLMKDDYLFVGAPRDGFNAAMGAVSIYRKESGQWVFKTKIAPPFQITPDAYFGYSITANDEYLAISGQWYDYDGAVFIYKKKSSWADLELVQTLPAFNENGHRYEMGHEVALNDNTLVVAAHDETGFRSVILFYKLSNGTFIRDGVAVVGRAAAAHRREISFSFNGPTLAAGCITSNPSGNALPGYVFLFEKDKNQQWDTVSMVAYPYSTNSFGSSVKLTDDHLFVGDAFYPANDVWMSGAVVVFVRPAAGWGSQQYHFEPASIITATNPREGDLFGARIDVAGNILIAGAPQSVLLLNPLRDNTNPGATYVVQGLDFNWTSTNQLFLYEGTVGANADRFGAFVSTDRNQFLIGAPFETRPLEHEAGAVYIIGMPPSVKLVAPMCVASGPVQLNGYPFDGIWSGPGIVDPKGIFDPALAGIGDHMLTYKTPNCFHEGRMQLEVKAGPTVQWDKTSPVLCDGPGREVLLSVTATGTGLSYQWWFKAIGSEVFEPVNTIGPAYSANQPGAYKVSVSNGACTLVSPPNNVSLELNPIEIAEPVITCSRDSKQQLLATPANGTWTGSGVSASGLMNPATLANGYHSASYSFTTTRGCTFSKTTTFRIDILTAPTLRAEGTFCDFNEVKVEVTNQQQGNYTYFKGSAANAVMVKEGYNTWDYAATSPGLYYVTFSDGLCSSTSAPVELYAPETMLTLIAPVERTCYLEEVSLTATRRASTEVFEWWYKEKEHDTPVALPGDSETITVAKPGYYMAESQLKLCRATSDWKHVGFTSADSLFVPNIFTPNGDMKNDLFQATFSATSEQSDEFLAIYNRYGEKIYETTGTLSWDGGNFPDGVYYWILSYRDCGSRRFMYKGLVHLRRNAE